MSQFSKEELSFVKELPEHVEIECPVCLNILTDPMERRIEELCLLTLNKEKREGELKKCQYEKCL